MEIGLIVFILLCGIVSLIGWAYDSRDSADWKPDQVRVRPQLQPDHKDPAGYRAWRSGAGTRLTSTV